MPLACIAFNCSSVASSACLIESTPSIARATASAVTEGAPSSLAIDKSADLSTVSVSVEESFALCGSVTGALKMDAEFESDAPWKSGATARVRSNDVLALGARAAVVVQESVPLEMVRRYKTSPRSLFTVMIAKKPGEGRALAAS